MPARPSHSRAPLFLTTVAIGCLWAAASRAAQPGTAHGYVEPCAVHFVETSDTECELCPVQAHDGADCAARLGALGYEKRCRTGGHSPPAEVWCIAKARKASSWQALLRRYVWVPLGIAAVAAALLLVRRRRGAK